MSLSESASAQVQAILQAAETSAEEIKREAQAEADRIRSTARESRQADVSGLLEMVASMRSELDALEARLRALHDEPAAPPETAETTRAPKAAPAVAKREEPAEAKAEAEADADVEGARLIALNMALNGEPREAADQYLAENFDLSDRAALLDEVYASVEG